MKLLPHLLAALCLATSTTAMPAHTTAVQVAPSSAPEQPPATTQQLQARQEPSTVPPYNGVTAAPTQSAALASLGYYQTTYYECKTRDGDVHCGWHIPVAKKKSGAGRSSPGRGGVWYYGVGVALGVAGWMVM